ncbi:MAG: phosphotransferase, partial [Acidobacteriota bacterium]|nr:phosphotransferase [Acidobacteriota bacterium]
ERVAILDVQYRPGESCIVLYKVKLRDTESGRGWGATLAGWILPPGTPVPRPGADQLARYTAVAEPSLGHPVIRLTDPAMIVFVSPLDPRLPRLVDASDPSEMKVRLGRLWSARDARVLRVRIHPMSHTPGARAAVGYEVLGESRTTGLPELRHLVGKIDTGKQAASVFSRSWVVWRASHTRIPIAPPIGHVAELNLFLQERVSGGRLAELAGRGSFLKPVRRTAAALADLHALPAPIGSIRTAQKDARNVQRWGDILATIRPASRARIERLRDRLAAELETRARMTGPIHGDLHPSNVLVCDDRVTLVDLDNMAWGDGLVDVGRFLSALRTSSLRVFGEPSGLRATGERFLSAYLALTGEDERRVRLYEAASLMVSAGSGFRLQRAGWERAADLVVEQAEDALSAALRGPVVAAEPRARRALPVIDRDLWATDPQYVRAALAAPTFRLYGAEVTGCTVTRERGSQALRRVRYRLTGWRGDERFRLSVTGSRRRGEGGRGAARRLEALSKALAGRPRALGIPRPLENLKEIGLMVLETPRGEALLPRELPAPPGSARISGPASTAPPGRASSRTPDGEPAVPDGRRRLGFRDELIEQSSTRDEEYVAALERLARALRELHATPVELDKTRTIEQEMRSLRHAVSRVSWDDDVWKRRASDVLAGIERWMADVSPRLGPVLRRICPRQVLRVRERLVLADVVDVCLSHPLFDVADLLARLAGLEAERRSSAPAVSARGRVRDVYLANAPELRRDLAAFEAAALLRAGCRARERTTRDAAAERLLAEAEVCLRFATSETRSLVAATTTGTNP